METIASKLKTRRESLDISLEQIAKNTRIGIYHLESLEGGRYAELPGGMYNRAILRAYCDEIGLDNDEILKCYNDEIAPEQKPAIRPPPRDFTPRTHTILVWSLIFIFGIGLFLSREWLAAALSPYFSSDYGGQISGLQPEQPTTTESDAQTENVAVKTIVQSKLQPLRLEIVGKEECWLSINSDESGTVTKTLSPGDVEFFTANRTISLIVGNAGGVLLRINDRTAKTLGQSGQVVRLTINEDTLPNLIDPSAS